MKHIIPALLLLLPFSLTAQNPASYNVALPVDIPVSLSGNFGELRSNHFHSGIDFRTQQVTGKNILAIESGYVSRAAVRPSGYGNVLYVTHPNGLTSVYAHLSAFSPRIDSVIRARQRAQKTNNFDFADFSPAEMPVERGEMIALSGNSGSSGGPHLHFEIRNTHNEHTLDPMQFYPQIIDKARPRISAVGVYAINSNSFVEKQRGKRFYTAVAKGTTGDYTLAKPIEVWGDIGFSIQGNDLMTGSNSVFGFYRVKLSCNKQVLYEREINEIDLATTNDLNSLIDYEERQKSKRFFEKAFVDKNNDLQIYTHLHNSGIYSAAQPDTAQCEFIVSDIRNNATSLQFTLIQKPLNDSELQVLPKLTEQGEWFDCKEEFRYSQDDFTFTADDKTFFTDFTFSAKEVTTPTKRSYYSKRYAVQTNQPIFKKNATIQVQSTLPDSLRGKALFERGGAAVFAKINSEGIATAQVKVGGTYGIVIDTTAPKIAITLAPGENMQQRSQLFFKISDDFSGIGSYNAYIDNVWTIIEYDAKTATVFLPFKYAAFAPNTMHELRIEVSDVVGNKAVKTISFFK
ncbi:MAG: M23 family metallopeptidase [Bacteroidales bacterium]|jgi:hypothetical protein|nr:M23 family metallopeptidase [Bacteroidales bacterium]